MRLVKLHIMPWKRAGIWFGLCSCYWTQHSHLAPVALGWQLLPPPERDDARVPLWICTLPESLSTAMAGLCEQAGSNEPNSCFMDFPTFTLYKLAWCKLRDAF